MSSSSSSSSSPLASAAAAAAAVVDVNPASTGYVGAVGFVVGVVLLNRVGPRLQFERALEASLLLVATMLPMVVWEATFLVLSASASASSFFTLDSDYVNLATAVRVVLKVSALSLLLTLVGTLYWLFDEYHGSLMHGFFDVDERARDARKDNNGYYFNFFRAAALLRRALFDHVAVRVLAVVALFVYTAALDRASFMRGGAEAARDECEYWHFARWVVSLWESLLSPSSSSSSSSSPPSPSSFFGPAARVEAMYPLLRHWAVKAFWGPLMFTYLCENLPMLHYHGFPTFMDFFRYANNAIFSLDVCIAAIGYCFSSRALGTHVRSTEPTALGWCVALVCYNPFFFLLTNKYLDYHRNPPWNEYLEHLGFFQDTVVFRAYGVVILVLEAAFAWCTLSFGLRYSNLSHRGLIVSGPYALTRHPAYVVKIFTFALLSVPWYDLRHGTAGKGRALRNCACLALLGLIYRVRAVTEERHLSSVSDDYAHYSAMIDERHARWLAAVGGTATLWWTSASLAVSAAIAHLLRSPTASTAPSPSADAAAASAMVDASNTGDDDAVADVPSASPLVAVAKASPRRVVAPASSSPVGAGTSPRVRASARASSPRNTRSSKNTPS